MSTHRLDLELARLCERAYREHTRVVGELEYLVSEVDGAPAVVVRGTETREFMSGFGWIDVIRDLRILPWYDRRVGWAHAGMLKGARRLFEELHIFEAFRASSPVLTAERVYVTGHSLGAGVGLILAHIMRYYGARVTFVGFGTPRSMISKLDPGLEARFYRQGDDPVTEVPRWWMGGYSALPVEQLGRPDWKAGAKDHSLERYIYQIEGLVERESYV